MPAVAPAVVASVLVVLVVPPVRAVSVPVRSVLVPVLVLVRGVPVSVVASPVAVVVVAREAGAEGIVLAMVPVVMPEALFVVFGVAAAQAATACSVLAGAVVVLIPAAQSGAADLVRLVAHDEYGDAVEVARLPQRGEERADVLQRLGVQQVVDQDEGVGVGDAVSCRRSSVVRVQHGHILFVLRTVLLVL